MLFKNFTNKPSNRKEELMHQMLQQTWQERIFAVPDSAEFVH